MPMPYSLVLYLVPTSPILPQYLTGRHFHALFLTLVSAVDRELGDYLHEQKDTKAFSLSPLQISPPNQRRCPTILQWEYSTPIPAGTRCWWRVSLLDDTLFSRLTELWMNINPDRPWHLGAANLYITNILGTPNSLQPWANAISYTSLYEQASESDRHLSFSFCTPTGFRQGQFDTSLPTRDSVFKSLLNRWNKYSGREFSAELIEVLFPSFFNVRTQLVKDSRSKFIGCVGDISYSILGEVMPERIKEINALADFALYCGAGRKTPMGMGMVRRGSNCY